MTALGLRPVSGNPPLTGRNDSPDTADPVEILALIVPGPVAGNPLHVFTFRRVFRRDFLNRLGRPLRHDQSGRGIRIVLFGERLVDRTASEYLHVFTGVGRRRSDDLLGGDPLRRRQDDLEGQILEIMETLEPIDARLEELAAARGLTVPNAKVIA